LPNLQSAPNGGSFMLLSCRQLQVAVSFKKPSIWFIWRLDHWWLFSHWWTKLATEYGEFNFQ